MRGTLRRTCKQFGLCLWELQANSSSILTPDLAGNLLRQRCVRNLRSLVPSILPSILFTCLLLSFCSLPAPPFSRFWRRSLLPLCVLGRTRAENRLSAPASRAEPSETRNTAAKNPPPCEERAGGLLSGSGVHRRSQKVFHCPV